MGSGWLWALVLAGASAPSSAPVPERLEAQTDRAQTSTYAAGEPVDVALSASGLAPGARTTLTLELNDGEGAVIASARLALVADRAGQASAHYTAPSARMGYYELHASLTDGTTLAASGSRPAGLLSYAVVPDPRSRKDYGAQATRFGLQGGFSVAAPVLPWLGARWVLWSGGGWATVERDAPGQFAAARAEAAGKARRWPVPRPEIEDPVWSGGRWHTYPMATPLTAAVPDWARAAGTEGTGCKHFGALNPRGVAGLAAFSAAYAGAFSADFAATSPRLYQLTWEPEAKWCYGGDAAGLVAIYAAAYPVIHRADPAALVAGPTLFLDSASNTQLAALWAAGLGRWIDVFALHPYIYPGAPETLLPGVLREQLAAVNRGAGHPLRFIGTEHGYEASTIGIAAKAEWDIRHTLILLGEGAWFDVGFYVHDFGTPAKIERYGFYWNLDPKLPFGTSRLGPKPIVPAYAAMTLLLDGSSSEGALTGLSGGQRGYRFARGDQHVAALWDWQGRSQFALPAPIAAAAHARRCDWVGNCEPLSGRTVTLSARPIYLVW